MIPFQPPPNPGPRSVFQPWVQSLTLMMQTVLIAAVRGPDGLRKNHPAKVLLRWYRRCFLRSAFDGSTIPNPWERTGGSFMGPSIGAPVFHWNGGTEMIPVAEFGMFARAALDGCLQEYLSRVDEMPHHFQLHLMHAAEILGYKHPDPWIRGWWADTYVTLVRDLHLNPETEDQMNHRLGDCFDSWRDNEVSPARDAGMEQ